MTIRNPIEWGWDQLKSTAHEVGAAGSTVHHAHHAPISVRSIGVADLGQALNRGLADFSTYRTDVVMMCLIYPVVGLVLYRLVTGYDMLPLLFPLASGFALIGPIAGMGLYEMSRRREEGHAVDWGTAFGVLRSPSFGAILTLSLLLTAMYVLWLTAAAWIYESTMGPELPTSISSFVHDVFSTSAGYRLIAIGCGVGFLFAVLTLMIGVISFPLLLDRDVGVDAAIWASIQACIKNPVMMAVWGMIVAAGLVLGSIPFFVGLIVVLPIVGHSTWHLYRRIVRPDTGPPHHHHRRI
jgi:uncharacterized membrane protein